MDVAHDFRLALRSLLRAPIFSGLVVISLAVSIGAATLASGVYYAVNVRPLAAEAPERLVTILAVQSEKCGMRCLDVFPMATFAALGAQSRSVVSTAAFNLDERLLRDSSARERIDVAAVSGPFFPLLGTSAYLGRPIQLSAANVFRRDYAEPRCSTPSSSFRSASQCSACAYSPAFCRPALPLASIPLRHYAAIDSVMGCGRGGLKIPHAAICRRATDC